MQRRRRFCPGSLSRFNSEEWKQLKSKQLKCTNAYINSRLRKESKQQRFNIKTILLGPPSCGKTTILKQLDIFINNGSNLSKISTDMNTANTIRQHCYDDILVLLERIGDTDALHTLQQLSITNDADLGEISCVITSALQKHHISRLYRDRYYSAVPSFVLHDNMDWFFDKIPDIMNINYKPTEQDNIIVKTCASLTEITMDSPDLAALFEDKIKFNLIDPGTNNSCRILNNRLYMFGNVDWVIFVASLGDYCDFEDEEKGASKMISTLNMFDNIINSQYFADSEVILLLNKLDIFADCIRRGISLKCCFNDWNGMEYRNGMLMRMTPQFVREINNIIPTDVVDIIIKYIDEFTVDAVAHQELLLCCCKVALEFIRKKYESKSDKERIHTFALNSTDTYLVENMFRRIQQVIGIATYTKFRNVMRLNTMYK